MLAPNKLLITDIPMSSISFPKLCSTKYNGVRGIFMKGFFYSRAGKPLRIPQQLLKELAPTLEWADSHHYVLDGELNSNSFNTTGETMQILAGTIPLPDDFQYKIFYVIPYKIWNNPVNASMEMLLSTSVFLAPSCRVELVKQVKITTPEEFSVLVEGSQYSGKEGYMLLNPAGQYKHGRCTVKEDTLLKYKYYGDMEDAKIVSITTRQVRKEEVTTGRTVYGYAKPTYKKEAFEDTDIGGCLIGKINGVGEPIHIPFPINYPVSTRRLALSRFGTGLPGDLDGKWVTFRRLACEDRNKPIAIKNVEFRDEKD